MYSHQTAVLKYQYVIIRDNFIDSDAATYYLTKNKHKLIATFGNDRKLSAFETKVDEVLNRYFDSHLLSSYSGKIYQRTD
jgi:hypothetical protein